MTKNYREVETSLHQRPKFPAIIFLVLNLFRAVAVIILLVGLYLQFFAGKPELSNHYPTYIFVFACLAFTSWVLRIAQNLGLYNSASRWWYILVLLGILCVWFWYNFIALTDF